MHGSKHARTIFAAAALIGMFVLAYSDDNHGVVSPLVVFFSQVFVFVWFMNHFIQSVSIQVEQYEKENLPLQVEKTALQSVAGVESKICNQNKE